MHSWWDCAEQVQNCVFSCVQCVAAALDPCQIRAWISSVHPKQGSAHASVAIWAGDCTVMICKAAGSKLHLHGIVQLHASSVSLQHLNPAR